MVFAFSTRESFTVFLFGTENQFTKVALFLSLACDKENFTRVMEHQIRTNVGKGIKILAFKLEGGTIRILGNKSFIQQFKEDFLAMSKMEGLLKGDKVSCCNNVNTSFRRSEHRIFCIS